MSWFDASGITNLAKTALKEAQKTIDKALDIQQEEYDHVNEDKNKKPTVDSPNHKNNTDFFSSWNLSSSNSLNTINSKDQPLTNQNSSKASHSIWGSFTGSFFDQNEQITNNEIKGINAVIDSTVNDDENKDKNDDIKYPDSKEKGSNFQSISNNYNELVEIDNSNTRPCANVSKSNIEEQSVIIRKNSDKTHNTLTNRLSIISSESGKNSSESIEILGSQSLKTTPESEITSLNHSVSTSSSLGLKLTSSSVEVIPDSLISPSSIELLAFTHSPSDQEFGSPLTSPMENDKQSNMNIMDNLMDDKSPVLNSHSSYTNDGDIKIISGTNNVNIDDEEVSAGDDTISYNSISEFTVPTIVDSPNIKSSEQIVNRKANTQFCGEMIDSFGSDVSSDTLRNVENIPITKPPTRNSSSFTSTMSGSSQSILAKDLFEKHCFQQPNKLNIVSCDDSFQSAKNEDTNLITSNEDLISEQTLDISIKQNISEKNLKDEVNVECNVKKLLEESNTDLSDKLSDSSSYCKINSDPEVLNSTWKETAFSSSSQSYEEVDKASTDNTGSENSAHIEFQHREPTSPVSSEGRSVDMLKICSEQTSGHTSGDDLETTTSSDIEIIPSPNGDYCSIYNVNRQSPNKLIGKSIKQSTGHAVDLILGKAIALKIRGHTRELSAASSQSNASDDSSEVDRLMKKIAELGEILEIREAKLIEISRHNIELNESIAELKNQVENLTKQDTVDVTMITDEYTQRLSALEKKFQQAIREKDILRKQMESYKQETSSRLTNNDLETAINERDETIKELREEGEKLSKLQLHHSTIIKRLRAKEKENEQVIKTLRDKVAEQAQELDRLKRSVSAKEAVECTQLETVYKLTTANKKLDSELTETKGQLEDAVQKYDTLKKSFEAAKKEMTELQKSFNDQIKNRETISILEKDKTALETENEQLLHQLEELRTKMRQEERKWMSRETSLRAEASRQMARAEEAESALLMSKNGIRTADSSDSSPTDGSILLAQLAALQENSLERDRRFQVTERRLQKATADAQTKLSESIEGNRLLKEECQSLRTKLSNTEINLSHISQKLEDCVSVCKEHMSQLQMTLESKERLKHEYESYKQETDKKILELSEKLKFVEQCLENEKNAHEADKRRNVILTEQLKEATASIDQTSGSNLLLARLVGNGESSNNTVNPNFCDRAGNLSPGSVGRESVASESFGSGIWLPDDDFVNNTGGIMAENVSSSSDTGLCTLERLQSALQRREGELRAARKAGRRSHAQKTALARELAIHAAELDNMQSLQHQYDALLQMYGEKEEQLQELRLDLQDVKDMYKMQLDEILMLKRKVNEKK